MATKKTAYGITGGIGSGKSFVCRFIEQAGFPVFYCDDEAKRIIRTDPAVARLLKDTVGNDVYDGDGRLQKAVLAAFICRGAEYAKKIDNIVHPRVREAFEHTSTARPTVRCPLLDGRSGFPHRRRPDPAHPCGRGCPAVGR